jgi:tetratricopeptide (TPR) repeat protein
MITTSVDPKDFSQIIPEERFSVDAPQTNPLMAASSLDVTRTENGLAFSVAGKTEGPELLNVERTLQDIVARCEKDLKVHPQSARSMFNLALALINAGRSDAGAELLREILRMEPTNYVALNSLALFLFNQGRLQEATQEYLHLHSAYPRDPSPLINVASIALREGDFVNAARYLERAVALDGCSAMAKYLLAMVLLRLGKNSQSVGLLRGALRDSGPSAELSQGLAIAYLISGDSKRAERAFLTALAINKQMASAVHGLALLRLQQHRPDEVVETLLEHLSHNAGDSQARELVAQAYLQLGQFSRARGQLTLLVPPKAETPEDRLELARINNNIGFCFANEGKVHEAELWLKRSVLLDGKSTAAPYTNLGRVFFSQGRLEEALDVLEQVDQLNLTNSDSSLLKSSVLIHLQRTDQAIEVLQSLVNSGSAPAAAYAELGWLLADWREEYDAAVAILREGFERDSSNVFLLNNLAYVHLMRGEPAAARAILDQVGDINQNPIVLTATRGLLSLWEGDIEGGEELYKKAESLAFQNGLRDLAISIRQKRHLEISRAYLRSGKTLDAATHIRLGLLAAGGQQFYRYFDQLFQLKERYKLSAGT